MVRALSRPAARRAAPSPRRIEILKSAAAAFRRRGYHGASVGEIARALHMTKGNLYYYFRDKEDILYVLHDWSVVLLLERLAEVERSGLGPAEKLRRLIMAFVHMIIDELVIAKRDRFDHGLRRIVAEGMESGAFVRGDPKLVAFAILGAINWITRWFDPAGPGSSDRIARSFADLMLEGLVARR